MAGEYFVGFGDIHGDVSNVERIPELPAAAAAIISGDLTNHGSPQAVERIIAAVRRINPVVYAQIGNMDLPETDAWLTQAGVNIHRRAVELAPGIVMLAVGYSSPTPFSTPSEVPDTRLGKWLEEAYAAAGDYKHLLLVTHDTPFNTAADLIGGGQHVGSQAVREFIERVQPDVCLTGHIHESRAVDRIGSTTVVNPGMLSAGGYVVLTPGDDGLCVDLKSL